MTSARELFSNEREPSGDAQMYDLLTIPPVVLEWLKDTRLWNEYVIEGLRQHRKEKWERKQRKLAKQHEATVLNSAFESISPTNARGSTSVPQMTSLSASKTPQDPDTATVANTSIVAGAYRSELLDGPHEEAKHVNNLGKSTSDGEKDAEGSGIVGSVRKASLLEVGHTTGGVAAPQLNEGPLASDAQPLVGKTHHAIHPALTLLTSVSSSSTSVAVSAAAANAKLSEAQSATFSCGSPRRPNSSSLDMTLNEPQVLEAMMAAAEPQSKNQQSSANMAQNDRYGVLIKSSVSESRPTDNARSGPNFMSAPADEDTVVTETPAQTSAPFASLSVPVGAFSQRPSATEIECPAISDEALLAEFGEEAATDLILTAMYAGPLMADVMGFDWRKPAAVPTPGTTMPAVPYPLTPLSQTSITTTPRSSHIRRSPRSMNCFPVNESDGHLGATQDEIAAALPPYSPPFPPSCSRLKAIQHFISEEGGLDRQLLWQHIASTLFRVGVEINILGFKQILLGFREVLVEMLILAFTLHTRKDAALGIGKRYAEDKRIPTLGYEDPTEVAQVLLSSGAKLQDTLLASAVTVDEYIRRLRVITAHRHYSAAHRQSRRPSLVEEGLNTSPRGGDDASRESTATPLQTPEGAVDPASVLSTVHFDRERRRASSCEPALTAHQCSMVTAFGPSDTLASGGPSLSSTEHNHLVLKEIVKKCMPRKRAAASAASDGDASYSASSASMPVEEGDEASRRGAESSVGDAASIFSGFDTSGHQQSPRTPTDGSGLSPAAETAEATGQSAFEPNGQGIPGKYFDGRYDNFAVFRAIAQIVMLEQLADPKTRFQCQFAAAVVLKDVCISFGFSKVFYWLVLNPSNDATIRKIQDQIVKTIMSPDTNADIHDFLIYLLVAISSPDRLVLLIEKLFQPRLDTGELIQLSAMLLQVPGEAMPSAVRWMLFLCSSLLDPTVSLGNEGWMPADIASAHARTQGLQHVSWRNLAKGEAGVTEYLPPSYYGQTPSPQRDKDSRSDGGTSQTDVAGSPIWPPSGSSSPTKKDAARHGGPSRATPNTLFKHQMRRDRDEILGMSDQLGDSQRDTDNVDGLAREGSEGLFSARSASAGCASGGGIRREAAPRERNSFGMISGVNGTLSSMSGTYMNTDGKRVVGANAHRPSDATLAAFYDNVMSHSELYADAMCLMLHIFAEFFDSKEEDLRQLVRIAAEDVVDFLQHEGSDLLTTHPSIVMELLGAAFAVPEIFMPVFAEAAASDEIFGDEDLRCDLLEAIAAMLYSFPTVNIASLAEAFLCNAYGPNLRGETPNTAMLGDVECMFLQELSVSLHIYQLRHEDQDGQLQRIDAEVADSLQHLKQLRAVKHTCRGSFAKKSSPSKLIKPSAEASLQQQHTLHLPTVPVTAQLSDAKRVTRQLGTIAAAQLALVVQQNINGERDMVTIADFAADEENDLRQMSTRREKGASPHANNTSPSSEAAGQPAETDPVRDMQVVLRRSLGRYVSDRQHTEWVLSLFALVLTGHRVLEYAQQFPSIDVLSVFPYDVPHQVDHRGSAGSLEENEGKTTTDSFSPSPFSEPKSADDTLSSSPSPPNLSAPPSRGISAPLPVFPNSLPSPISIPKDDKKKGGRKLSGAKEEVPFMSIVYSIFNGAPTEGTTSPPQSPLLNISHATCASVGLMYRAIQNTVRAVEAMMLVKHAAVSVMLMEWHRIDRKLKAEERERRRSHKATARKTSTVAGKVPAPILHPLSAAVEDTRASFDMSVGMAAAEADKYGDLLGLLGNDSSVKALGLSVNNKNKSLNFSEVGGGATASLGGTSLNPTITLSTSGTEKEEGQPSSVGGPAALLIELEEEERIGVALRALLWLCHQMGIGLPSTEEVSDAMASLARPKAEGQPNRASVHGVARGEAEKKGAKALPPAQHSPRKAQGDHKSQGGMDCPACALEHSELFGCLRTFLPARVLPTLATKTGESNEKKSSSRASALSEEWRQHIYKSFADDALKKKDGEASEAKKVVKPLPLMSYGVLLRQDVSSERSRYATLLHHHGFDRPDCAEASLFAVPDASLSSAPPSLGAKRAAPQQQQQEQESNVNNDGNVVSTLPLEKVHQQRSENETVAVSPHPSAKSSKASPASSGRAPKAKKPTGIAALAIPMDRGNKANLIPKQTSTAEKNVSSRTAAGERRGSELVPLTPETAAAAAPPKSPSIEENNGNPTKKSTASGSKLRGGERKRLEQWMQTVIVEPLVNRAAMMGARQPARKTAVAASVDAQSARKARLASLREIQKRQAGSQSASMKKSPNASGKKSPKHVATKDHFASKREAIELSSVEAVESFESHRRRELFEQQLQGFIAIIKIHQEDAKAAARRWLEALEGNEALLRAVVVSSPFVTVTTEQHPHDAEGMRAALLREGDKSGLTTASAPRPPAPHAATHLSAEGLEGGGGILRQSSPSFGPTLTTARDMATEGDASLSARSMPKRPPLPLARGSHSSAYQSNQQEVRRQRQQFINGQAKILEDFKEKEQNQQQRSKTRKEKQSRRGNDDGLGTAEVDAIPKAMPTANTSIIPPMPSQSQAADRRSVTNASTPHHGLDSLTVPNTTVGGDTSAEDSVSKKGSRSSSYIVVGGDRIPDRFAELAAATRAGSSDASINSHGVDDKGPASARNTPAPAALPATAEAKQLAPLRQPPPIPSSVFAANSAPPQARSFRKDSPSEFVPPSLQKVLPTKFQLGRSQSPTLVAANHHLKPIPPPQPTKKKTQGPPQPPVSISACPPNQHLFVNNRQRLLAAEAPKVASDETQATRNTYPVPQKNTSDDNDAQLAQSRSAVHHDEVNQKGVAMAFKNAIVGGTTGKRAEEAEEHPMWSTAAAKKRPLKDPHPEHNL